MNALTTFLWVLKHPFQMTFATFLLLLLLFGGYASYEVGSYAFGYQDRDQIMAKLDYAPQIGNFVLYGFGGIVALFKSGWLTRLATIGVQVWLQRRREASEAMATVIQIANDFKAGKLVSPT
jgi:hypothetical protein